METQQLLLSDNFTSPAQSVDPACGGTRCNSRGTCVVPSGGGSDLVCDCKLGYGGDFCEQTINGALSAPLTLSILGVLLGLATLAFVLAKLRRKKKKQHRRNVEAQPGYKIAE